MNNNSFNKICTIIIYVLTIILICLILYSMFLVISTSDSKKYIPKNSVKVSPIADDKGHNALNLN